MPTKVEARDALPWVFKAIGLEVKDTLAFKSVDFSHPPRQRPGVFSLGPLGMGGLGVKDASAFKGVEFSYTPSGG